MRVVWLSPLRCVWSACAKGSRAPPSYLFLLFAVRRCPNAYMPPVAYLIQIPYPNKTMVWKKPRVGDTGGPFGLLLS